MFLSFRSRGKIFAVSALVAFAGVAGLPSPASAGFLSFLSDMLSRGGVAVSEERPMNVQNIPLLQPAMNLDPNPSKGGGDIITVEDTALLPETGPSGSLADIEESETNGKISVYVVREGDSLSDIAKMFRVSVNTVVWANDISRGIIRPGQTLVILPITGIRHTVTKGETLAGIAKKYRGDADEITQFNGLEGKALAVGDSLLIPDGVLSPAPSSAPARTSRLSGSGGPTYEGYYLRPLIGGRKTQGLHGYNGIDFGSPLGTPVLASASGQTIVSRDYGWNGGYGKYIVISHDNGTQTLYGHLSGTIVSSGQYVVRGQVIGYLGNTGRSTGPHLHFEIRGAKNPF